MKRVCLVGCGRIARVHARNLRGRVRLSAFSRRPGQAQDLLAACGGGEVFPDWDAVLGEPDLAAVVICTPPEAHVAQASTALAAGKSVLLEKPACLDTAGLAVLTAAAEAQPETFLMVAENYYYKPLLARLRACVTAGRLGRLERLWVGKQTQQAVTDWRSHHGALLEGGIHFVALIGGVLEACGAWEPLAVQAEFPTRVADQPERRSRLELRYPDSMVAMLDYAWDRPARLRGVGQHSHLLGARGSVTFESNGLYGWGGNLGTGVWLATQGDLMGYQAMTRDFLACLDEPGRQPFSDLRRASRDLRVVFAAYGTAAAPTLAPGAGGPASS